MDPEHRGGHEIERRGGKGTKNCQKYYRRFQSNTTVRLKEKLGKKTVGTHLRCSSMKGFLSVSPFSRCNDNLWRWKEHSNRAHLIDLYDTESMRIMFPFLFCSFIVSTFCFILLASAVTYYCLCGPLMARRLWWTLDSSKIWLPLPFLRRKKVPINE